MVDIGRLVAARTALVLTAAIMVELFWVVGVGWGDLWRERIE